MSNCEVNGLQKWVRIFAVCFKFCTFGARVCIHTTTTTTTTTTTNNNNSNNNRNRNVEVSRLRARGSMNQGLCPDVSKKYDVRRFRHGPWGSLILLWTHGLFSRKKSDKGVTLPAHQHLFRRLRIHGAIPPFSHTPSECVASLKVQDRPARGLIVVSTVMLICINPLETSGYYMYHKV
jgi:hypothetical protein